MDYQDFYGKKLVKIINTIYEGNKINDLEGKKSKAKTQLIIFYLVISLLLMCEICKALKKRKNTNKIKIRTKIIKSRISSQLAR